MNLTITGHHVEVTQAIKEYVVNKLDRVLRHFDGIISVHVTLSVEKLQHKCETTVHIRGKDIHVESEEPNMYAAIDLLVDKLDRQLVKNKEKHEGARKSASLKNMTIDE